MPPGMLDVEADLSFFSPDVEEINPFSPSPMKGKEEMRRLDIDLLRAVPDLLVQLLNVIIQVDRAKE